LVVRAQARDIMVENFAALRVEGVPFASEAARHGVSAGGRACCRR